MKLELPQYVLFDLDGTLVDSLPGIVFSVDHALSEVGLPKTDADLGRFLGPPIRTIFSKILPNADYALLDRLERAFRSSYDSEGWEKTTCYQGAMEVLAAMTLQHRRLFIVTNKPRAIALRVLERQGLLSHFERFYTPDSRVPPFLSKSEMLSTFLHDYGISPSDCLMVGDTMEDVVASAANQMNIAIMEHGYGRDFDTVPLNIRMRDFSAFLTSLTEESVR